MRGAALVGLAVVGAATAVCRHRKRPEPTTELLLEGERVMIELHLLTAEPDRPADEIEVLERLKQLVIDLQRPVGTATAQWQDRYLLVIFDSGPGGAPLRVLHGDGYTQLDGTGVKYRGYLPPDDLLAEVRRLLRAGTQT